LAIQLFAGFVFGHATINNQESLAIDRKFGCQASFRDGLYFMKTNKKYLLIL